MGRGGAGVWMGLDGEGGGPVSGCCGCREEYGGKGGGKHSVRQQPNQSY